MSAPEQKIRFIHNGVVIDHVRPGAALSIADLLDLRTLAAAGGRVSIGMNYASKRGLKDFIKVETFEITESTLAYVALASPAATINVIRDGEVASKTRAEVPEEIGDVVWCPDGFCITNHEDVPGRFRVVAREPLVLKCHYCETRFYDKLISFKRSGERRKG